MVLFCPRCRYNLTGLVEHRCPECGTPFDPLMLALAPPWWAKPMFRRELVSRFCAAPAIGVLLWAVTTTILFVAPGWRIWKMWVLVPPMVVPLGVAIYNSILVAARVMLAPEHEDGAWRVRPGQIFLIVATSVGVCLMQITLFLGLVAGLGLIVHLFTK